MQKMPNPETTDPYQCGWCRGAGKVPQMDDGPIDCPVCKGTGRKNALSRTTIDWAARAAAHANMDGDEWDAEEELFRAEWQEAYTAAFVEIAVARGWQRRDAVTWPPEIAGEAYIEAYTHKYDPRLSAEADVVACEEPL